MNKEQKYIKFTKSQIIGRLGEIYKIEKGTRAIIEWKLLVSRPEED